MKQETANKSGPRADAIANPATSQAAEAPAQALDHESRVQDGDHEALRLWLRLLTCTNLIEAQIRANLRADFNCTLPRFDLMAQLYRHPAGLKMGELSRRLMVTGGNVTGVADQLVKEGLVQRETDARDRRAFLLRLTPGGRKSFAKMAARHEEWVAGLLGRLPEADRHTLYELLGRLKSTLKEASA